MRRQLLAQIQRRFHDLVTPLAEISILAYSTTLLCSDSEGQCSCRWMRYPERAEKPLSSPSIGHQHSAFSLSRSPEIASWSHVHEWFLRRCLGGRSLLLCARHCAGRLPCALRAWQQGTLLQGPLHEMLSVPTSTAPASQCVNNGCMSYSKTKMAQGLHTFNVQHGASLDQPGFPTGIRKTATPLQPSNPCCATAHARPGSQGFQLRLLQLLPRAHHVV